MLIWTTRISKKTAIFAVILLGLVIAAAILLAGRGESTADSGVPQLTTNDERVAYLQSLGWEVLGEPVETLQFVLPETLDEPYLSYSELQDSQGFDFAACCGKQVARYTYTVCNYPGRSEGIQANLYICEGIPVGGDIFCAGSDGFQSTLVYPTDS